MNGENPNEQKKIREIISIIGRQYSKTEILKQLRKNNMDTEKVMTILLSKKPAKRKKKSSKKKKKKHLTTQIEFSKDKFIAGILQVF